jgi:glutaconate CoA-transferase subunit B
VSGPAAPDVVAFLASAAQEFRRGGWVFTGFHWPVLAGELAARLDRAEGRTTFAQLFEAGGVTIGPAADALPTSTTDHPAFGASVRWRGTTSDVLGCLVRRASRVVLDAANVDVRGRVNSTMVGDASRPAVRLPGGGGAAEAAAGARELVLLYGGADPNRIAARVEHVTAAPGDCAIRLLTRWGTLELGPAPRLMTCTDASGDLITRLRRLGVATDRAVPAAEPTGTQARLATGVLVEAAERGYAVARAALSGR